MCVKEEHLLFLDLDLPQMFKGCCLASCCLTPEKERSVHKKPKYFLRYIRLAAFVDVNRGEKKKKKKACGVVLGVLS